MHDEALRVGVFDASESYGHARRARSQEGRLHSGYRVGARTTEGQSTKKFRRPTSNFEEELDEI